MATNEVVVVGAGPTGLMLACELTLGGVKTRLLDERTDMPNITRAFAVHARTLELLDARGLADEVLAHGNPVYELAPPGGATLDLRELHTRFGMLLIVPQSGTERVLEARANEFGVEIVRGAQLVGLAQDDDGVTVDVAGGDAVRADYVVGCDGAHSAVRRLLGIDFVGKQYETHILLADVRLASPPPRPCSAKTGAEGLVLFIPFGDGWFRAIAWDRLREQAPLAEPVTLDEIRDAFRRIAGEDFGMGETRWSTRFLRAPAGRPTGRPGVPGRRRRACPLAARRTGHEHRHPRRDQPGLEAGRSDARLRAVRAVGHLREGAPSRRRRCAEADRCLQPVGARPLGSAASTARLRHRNDPADSAEPPADRRTPQRDRHRLSALA